jgi:HEAT repeat protein
VLILKSPPTRIIAGLIVSAALLACLIGPALPCGAALRDDLAALANQMPDADKDGRYTGPTPEDAEKAYAEIIKGGADSAVGLVGLMVEPGKGDDYKVRYLLHGLVTYVARPGAEKDRQMVWQALLSTLGGATPKAVQAAVVQELQALGTKETAAPLGKFLLDDDLCDPVARALIGFGDTADIFRAALPAAKGRNRITIIQALGVLRDAKAALDLQKAAVDPDADVRISARDALGNIGDAASVDTLLAATHITEPYERIKATEAALVLADRLLAAGQKKDSERIYKHLWDSRTTVEERHVRIAALHGLAAIRADMNDLLAAMKTGDVQVRAAAIRLATATPGKEVTLQCVEAMEKASSVDRASLLAILGARGDPAAMRSVLGMFKDPDESVRAAAMLAAGAIGGEGASEALLATAGEKAGKDREAALDALTKARGTDASAAVAAAMTKSSDPALKVPLLDVLAARRASDQMSAVMEAAKDSSAPVRMAALKALGTLPGDQQLPTLVAVLKDTKDGGELGAAEAALKAACARDQRDRCADLVSAALPGAAPANAAAMIRVLGAAGTRKAMDTVLATTKDGSPELKEAAVRSLADWRNKDAAAPLLEVVRNTDNATMKVLALRGAIRLASAKGTSNEDKMKILPEAMRLAVRPEEKREVLGGLATVQTLAAFQAAAPCLDDDAVSQEAAAAVVQIADKIAKQNADAVRDALTKAARIAKDERVRAAAERILGQIKKP